jgi:autotransporter translocation and assembly factor TamB
MRLRKILLRVGLGLVGLVVLLGIATVIVVQTDWFRGFVRQKIITATETGTGGRVELRSFAFDPWKLEAVMTDFVIHGKEPQGAAPWVRAARVRANFRLFTSLRRILDISYLGVSQPQSNIMVFADGTTNIPEPKEKTESNTTVLDTVIDLAVDRFFVSDGLLVFDNVPSAFNIHGNNLHALLNFDLVNRRYQGTLAMQPIYVVSGRNTPVVFTVSLPVVLERKRIGFQNARIATAESEILINGTLDDLKNPQTNAKINGHLALDDLQKLANVTLDTHGRGLPSVVEIDGNAAIANNRITVTGLRLGLGASQIEASGTLKDPQGNGSLQFKTTLALDQLGRLAKLAAKPAGTLLANGTAKLDAANNYALQGEVEGRGISFSQGAERIRNVNLHSALSLDPHTVDLRGLRLDALGGEFEGNASMEDFARYHVAGNLRHFDIQTVTTALGNKPLPYDGAVSGPVEANGDLKARTPLTAANAKLTIAPGRRGIPMTGRINAQYNGASGDINLADSYVALPNTRLNLSGSLNRRLNLDLTSHNLSDLLAAAGPNPPAIKLEGGVARFAGYVTGGVSSPHVYGHLAMNQFSAEGRRFDSLALDADASKSRAAVSNGMLLRGPMQTQFAAAVGLANWSPTPNQPLQATVVLRNGDLADVMALAGQSPAGYAGALSADANINGTVGNPTGTADLKAVNGKIQDEPFDRIQARVNMSDRLITVPAATLTYGSSRLDLSAEFQHPRDSLSTGQLHAHVQSNQWNLQQIPALQRERPGTAGALNLTADVRGDLTKSEFLLTAVNADASARGLRFEGQNYGDATLKATTSGSTVAYNLVSDFAGSNIQLNGRTELTKDYPTVADATLRNLPVERVLAVAKQNLPASGALSGTAHVSGTLQNPQGNANFDLVKAVVYDEPLDRVHAEVAYLSQRVDVSQLQVTAGPSRIDLTARYDHPAGKLDTGDLTFKVNSSRIDLTRVHNIQTMRPGLGGVLQIAANGEAKVQPGATPLVFRDLNADVSATGVSAQGKNFGDATLKATTNAGRLNFTLDSDLASAQIHGRGNAVLSGDYPIDATLDFRNVTWSRLQPLISPPTGPATFDASTEGQITVAGPLTKTDQLRGSVRIPTLEVTSMPPAGSKLRPVQVRNQGPISATLDRGVVRIENAHLVGPQTDISATGTASITQTQTMNLRVHADTDIGLLQNFDRDIFASGKVVLAANVAGTLAKPQVNGTLDLQNASVNYVDVPNGLSNANGTIVFNGDTATIRNLTGESGGGKVALAGFVSFADTLRLGLRATATNVRIRPEPGISVVVSATVNVTGTTKQSLASGNVTINRVTYAPQSDFGSILSRAAPPAQAEADTDSILEHMRLDIRVRTSSLTAVQAALAENLQFNGDLRVRGTAARPGMLGRLVITSGDLVFFGSKYHVNNGAIGFYDPLRIEPVLDFSLETQAKGVNVVLNVRGPVDNMKLSYTSEPPLQFQEIVSLLASGKTPTSDPTLLANQPSTPDQSFQQMGESAVVSKALADPVANRLQRVFGVSQLKIDPAFTSGSDLPQARVTLQQQVAQNITFTYVTALDDPNSQTIRIEWAFNPRWSAVANRDENGMFSINLFYKKQFR